MTLVDALEHEVGRETVLLMHGNEMALSVNDDLTVRVRIYAPDKRTLLADIATTPMRALNIAGLFKRAAERADASLVQQVAP